MSFARMCAKPKGNEVNRPYCIPPVLFSLVQRTGRKFRYIVMADVNTCVLNAVDGSPLFRLTFRIMCRFENMVAQSI